MSSKFDSRLFQGDSRYILMPGQYDETKTNIFRNKNPANKIWNAKRKGLYNSLDNPGTGLFCPDRSKIMVRQKTKACKIGTWKWPDLNQVDKTT